MDIDYYRDFLTIARCGTIAGAARQLRIAQPALSYRLHQLEEYLGAPLLETARGSRSIVLTEAGQYLYQRAHYLLATEDNIKREVTHHLRGMSGTLKISLSPSTAMVFIRERLVPFSRAYPHVQHEIAEVSIAQQTELLLTGAAEIGVANAPLHRSEEFLVLERETEALVVAVARESAWHSSGEPLSLADLRHVPLALSRGCSSLFLSACRAADLRPQVLAICTTRSAALMWARENRAPAIVPAQNTDSYDRDLRYIPLLPAPEVEKSIVIVRDRPLTKVAQNFLDFFHLLPPDAAQP